MTALTELLDDLVNERLFCVGYQAHVRVGDDVILDIAGGTDGLGRPMATDSKVAMYCSAKSLLATAAAVLVSKGELSFEDRVGDLIKVPSAMADLTIGDVLHHRSGIHSPNVIEGTIMSPERRREVALTGPPASVGANTYYTECASWLVLGECLLSLMDDHAMPAMVANDLVLDPLGLRGEFDLDGTDDEHRRIAVSLRNDRTLPLLMELGDQLAFTTNPGYGGFATMRGHAGLMQGLLAARLGTGELEVDPEVAAQVFTPGPVRWDETMGRDCSFGLGFATQLDTHGFGTTFSDTAIAQSGLLGMTTVVADPETQMSVAIHINGLSDADSVVGWLRGRLFAAAALHEAL